ncbi:MAG: hypothetical protein Q8S01_04010 [Ignavibacteria bacterium]|nr:hypothetical protein [Ignavibacteria bacterium]
MPNRKHLYYKNLIIALITSVISGGFGVSVNAQVSGISGAKLCVPDAGALSNGSFEFEPSFSVFSSENKFCKNGSTESLCGESISSNVMFRVTAGVADQWEIGAAFSSTIEQVSFGTKYILADLGKFNLALIAGVSLPAGNKFLADTLTDKDHHLTSSFGSIASLKLVENSSLDFIFSYTRIHGVHQFNNILNYGAGVGYWLSEKFQGVIELNGFATYNGKLQSHKLSVSPGITYKTSDRLLFVFGFQVDLLGKNEDKGFGYFSAFTITF